MTARRLILLLPPSLVLESVNDDENVDEPARQVASVKPTNDNKSRNDCNAIRIGSVGPIYVTSFFKYDRPSSAIRTNCTTYVDPSISFIIAHLLFATASFTM